MARTNTVMDAVCLIRLSDLLSIYRLMIGILSETVWASGAGSDIKDDK